MPSAETPYYHLVPKDLRANLRWRREVVTEGCRDPAAAREFWKMCARDQLFYINTFCWAYNAKDYPAHPIQPFITHEQQDVALVALTSAWLSGQDVIVYKGRDTGGTQVCVANFEWAWHFHEGLSFLIASRKEELVDKTGDTRTLFYRLDFTHKHQPRWLLPTGRALGAKDPCRALKHLLNADNGSVIDGEATVEGLGVGDKRTAILLDERARMNNNKEITRGTSETTRCRVSNSTMRGTGGSAGEFYRLVKRAEKTDQIRLVKMFWPGHPEKSQGLYTSINHAGRGEHPLYELIVLDKGYRFPHNYPFILDGDRIEHLGYEYRLPDGRRVKVRSPYYDDYVAKNGQESADQELDGSAAAGGAAFFDPDRLREIIEQYVRRPYTASLTYAAYTGEEPEVALSPGGELHLYHPLLSSGRPPEDDYVIGCDIATGSPGPEATPSVATVASKTSHEKVAEVSLRMFTPEEFAVYIRALAEWYWNAQVIHENNGPGGSFGKILYANLGYRRVWFNENLTKVSQSQTRAVRSKIPGLATRPRTKTAFLGVYRRMLFAKEFINPSERALKECLEILHGTGGEVYHSGEKEDSVEAGENHADHVIADALVCHVLNGRNQRREAVKQTTAERDPPHGSLAWRMKQAKEQEPRKQRRRKPLFPIR